jgi:hypothetical protein
MDMFNNKFEIKKDSRMTKAERLLFNIYLELKELNSNLTKNMKNINNKKSTKK